MKQRSKYNSEVLLLLLSLADLLWTGFSFLCWLFFFFFFFFWIFLGFMFLDKDVEEKLAEE
jgi:hypothetical protein